ncbi:unnamed protein product [Parajaminaea phylloscopi]
MQSTSVVLNMTPSQAHPSPSSASVSSPSRLPQRVPTTMSACTRSRTRTLQSISQTNQTHDGGATTMGKRSQAAAANKGTATRSRIDESTELVDDFGRRQKGSMTAKHQREPSENEVENSPASTSLKRNRNTVARRGSGISDVSSPSTLTSRTLPRRIGASPRTVVKGVDLTAQLNSTASATGSMASSNGRKRTLSRIPGLAARPRQSSGSGKHSSPCPNDAPKSRVAVERSDSPAVSAAEVAQDSDAASGLVAFGGAFARSRSFSFNSRALPAQQQSANAHSEPQKQTKQALGPPNSLRSRHMAKAPAILPPLPMKKKGVDSAATSPAAKTTIKTTHDNCTDSHHSVSAQIAGAEVILKREVSGADADRQSPGPRHGASPASKPTHTSLFTDLVGHRDTRERSKQQQQPRQPFLQTPEARERAMRRLSGHLAFPMTGKILTSRPPSALATQAPNSAQVATPTSIDHVAKSTAGPDRSPVLAMAIADESVDIRALSLSPEPDSPVLGLRMQNLPPSKTVSRQSSAALMANLGKAQQQHGQSKSAKRLPSSPEAVRDSSSPTAYTTMSRKHSAELSPPVSTANDTVALSHVILDDPTAEFRRLLLDAEQQREELAASLVLAEDSLSRQSLQHHRQLTILEDRLSGAVSRATAAEQMASEGRAKLTHEAALSEDKINALQASLTSQTGRLEQRAQRAEDRYNKLRQAAATAIVEKAVSGWVHLAPAARAEAETAAQQTQACHLALLNLDVLESMVLRLCVG